MPPESIQGYILLAYSIFFLCLAVFVWILKRKNSKAIMERGPCRVYFRMRYEVAKLFDKRELNADKSKFDEIREEMR